MSDLVIVHGTWGRAQPWHLYGSSFRAEAEDRFDHVWDFLWSGALYGLPTDLPGDPAEAANGGDNGALLPWLDAGEKLALYLLARNIVKPCVLSHSHGLQVVTFSAWRGAEYDTAVSISGPVRHDMMRARRRARSSMRRWIQFVDPDDDRTIREGQWFGGAHDVFDLPEGESIHTPGSGHSGLVNDPALREKHRLWEIVAA